MSIETVRVESSEISTQFVETLGSLMYSINVWALLIAILFFFMISVRAKQWDDTKGKLVHDRYLLGSSRELDEFKNVLYVYRNTIQT